MRKEKKRYIGQNINKNINFTGKELLTVEEASIYLSISVSTMKKWVSKRKIPVIKLGSSRKSMVRIRKKDLEKWLDKQLDINQDN